jgi:gluconokinase
MIEWRRRAFLSNFLAETPFTVQIVFIKPTTGNRKPWSKWYGHSVRSGPLTLYCMTRSFPGMQTQTPCSDYIETQGLIYFARMLDKIRLHAADKLDPGYFVGVEDPTFFDARCTRFLGVNYDDLVERTLKGGSDEEILEWCFERGRRPSEEEITIWNAFLSKRGWRDDASSDLQVAKERSGLGDRDDIQTWIDLHDVEEGRTPKH